MLDIGPLGFSDRNVDAIVLGMLDIGPLGFGDRDVDAADIGSGNIGKYDIGSIVRFGNIGIADGMLQGVRY